MLGLTLEGGGAKGAYHIGAWRAFRELGIQFDGITGTSVGALNGALMVQEDFDIAWDIWNNINPYAVMNIDEKTIELISDYQLNTEKLNLLYGGVKKVIKGSGIDVAPLEELIKTNLKEDKLRSCKTDFGFVTVCLTDRRPMEIFKEDIPYGRMAEYLLTSAQLPIFKGNRIDGKAFLDGGFYDNLPTEMLYKKGYRKIIAVRLRSMGRIRRITHNDLEVINILPRKKLGSMMDFSTERSRTNMTLGYLDAMKVLKQLKGRDYYIACECNDDEALRFFMNLSDKTINKLIKLLKLPANKAKPRLILEDVIPRFAKIMDISDGGSYIDILLGIVEHMAAIKNVDPLRIYTIQHLLMEINKSATEDTLAGSKGNEIIDDIFLRINREKLLKEIIKLIFNNEKVIISQ